MRRNQVCVGKGFYVSGFLDLGLKACSLEWRLFPVLIFRKLQMEGMECYSIYVDQCDRFIYFSNVLSSFFLFSIQLLRYLIMFEFAQVYAFRVMTVGFFTLKTK